MAGIKDLSKRDPQHLTTLIEGGLYNTLEELFVASEVCNLIPGHTDNGTLYLWRRIKHRRLDGKEILYVIPCLNEHRQDTILFVARLRCHTHSHLVLDHSCATRYKILIVEHLEEYLRGDVIRIVAREYKLLTIEDLAKIHPQEVATNDIIDETREILFEVSHTLTIDLHHLQRTWFLYEILSHDTHTRTDLQHREVTIRLIYRICNPLCDIQVSEKMLTQVLLWSYLFHSGCKDTKKSEYIINLSFIFRTFAPMELKSILANVVKIVLPFILGGAILWWMYRGEDLSTVSHVLKEEMNWTWMLLSFPFGILAQMFRGWRWKQTLEPMGEKPRTSICLNAVFLSYAASLVIPRIGEFSRCAVLKRYEGISFSKALGTVVTERAVDTLLVMIYSGIILLVEMSVFGTFFKKTGTSLDHILERFSLTGWIVTAICGIAALILLHLFLKNLSIYNKVKMTLGGIWEGVLSLRGIRNLPLYIFFSVGIWVMYFLHYYLTFFCFDFTENLGIGCALVSFVVANFAVIVPTPNGAGPWHFAIKTMLILYGVADEQALWFVLIVHTVQTMLVIALGVYSWAALSFTKRQSNIITQ